VRVIWRAEALDERRRIFSYLAERNPAAALRRNEALILAADGLATFPNRGRPGKAAGTRELVAVSPYLLIYEVDDAAGPVRILSVGTALETADGVKPSTGESMLTTHGNVDRHVGSRVRLPRAGAHRGSGRP
jgi:toxin ParE1/3/4